MKYFNNNNGTTSRSFQIGKNRLIVDNIDNGLLRFSLYDSSGVLTQWKMNSDDNSVEFPSGDKIVIDKISKDVLFSLGEKSINLGVNIPETTDLVNFTEEKLLEDIPNTWAVWQAILRVTNPIMDRLDEIESRLSVIEAELGIIHE